MHALWKREEGMSRGLQKGSKGLQMLSKNLDVPTWDMCSIVSPHYPWAGGKSGANTCRRSAISCVGMVPYGR